MRVVEHKTFVAVYNHPRAKADTLLLNAAGPGIKAGQARKPRAKKLLKGETRCPSITCVLVMFTTAGATA